MSATLTGTIKNVIRDRGYGFISLAGGEAVFFHMTALTDRSLFADLEPGDEVIFEMDAASVKGPRAKWVTVTSGPISPAVPGSPPEPKDWERRVSAV